MAAIHRSLLDPGDNPATNSSAAGSCKPWISGESCGSETPPPPPPPPPACTFTNWSSGINYTLGNNRQITQQTATNTSW